MVGTGLGYGVVGGNGARVWCGVGFITVAVIRRDNTSFASSQCPREADAIRLDDEADKSCHSDTAMFDLSMAQPANGGRFLLPLHSALDQSQRIIEANRRIQLLGENLEVRRAAQHRSDR